MEIDTKTVLEIMQDKGLKIEGLATSMKKTKEGVIYILANRQTKLPTIDDLASALGVKPKDIMTS